VIEPAAGVRPDGVLSQIRQMNAQREGTAATAAAGGAAGGFLAKTKSLFGNLRLGRKG
jgi:hypothetical protein